MGEKAFSIDIPSLVSSPDCGTEPVLENLSITALVQPDGADMSKLVTLDLDKEQI